MQVCPPSQGPLAQGGAHFILRWRSCRCGACRPCLQVAPSSRYWRKSRPRRTKRAEAKALTGERRPRAAWRIALCRARTRPPRSQAARRSKPRSIDGAVERERESLGHTVQLVAATAQHTKLPQCQADTDRPGGYVSLSRALA